MQLFSCHLKAPTAYELNLISDEVFDLKAPKDKKKNN